MDKIINFAWSFHDQFILDYSPLTRNGGKGHCWRRQNHVFFNFKTNDHTIK